MATYLTYAPIVLILVWGYLAYKWHNMLKRFKAESGGNAFFPYNAFRFRKKEFKTEAERLIYQKHIRESLRQFRIWLLTLIIFIVVTFIVGILTAK